MCPPIYNSLVFKPKQVKYAVDDFEAQSIKPSTPSFKDQTNKLSTNGFEAQAIKPSMPRFYNQTSKPFDCFDDPISNIKNNIRRVIRFVVYVSKILHSK